METNFSINAKALEVFCSVVPYMVKPVLLSQSAAGAGKIK